MYSHRSFMYLFGGAWFYTGGTANTGACLIIPQCCNRESGSNKYAHLPYKYSLERYMDLHNNLREFDVGSETGSS
jgi:hypothetical protein